MKSLKNYFLVFILAYITVLITKLIFLLTISTNITTDETLAIIYGYKFDFAISAIVAFLATLYEVNKKFTTILSSILITVLFLIQLSDILYFLESSRHVSYEILDLFVDAKSLLLTALSQHTLFYALSLLFTLLIFIFLYKFFNKNFAEIKFKKSYLISKLSIIILTVFFVRGMFQHIPLNPWQANQIGNTNLTKYVLNGAYSAVYSALNSKKNLKPLHLKQPLHLSLQNLYNDTKTLNKSLPIIKTKPNIIFFFLESWSAVHLKPYGGKYETTPEFDKILLNSLRPKAMVAGGHRTTEGMFTSLVSFQNPLGKSVAKTQLQSFDYKSIINILATNGYSSAFFQGSSKETSGTGSLANSLGFKLSFGKIDVKERMYEPNYWGIHDEDLYNFVNLKLKTTLKEPFVLGINGATTHDNKIPKQIKEINFTSDKNINGQLNALHFSDASLGKFVKEIEKKYPNTIFVLLADHCGGGIKGTLENYLIPFAIYGDKIEAKYIDKLIAQRDISPTLLDITLGDYKKIAPYFTGKSLIQDEIFFVDYFHNGILGWIEDKKVIEINSATNKQKCFELNNLSKTATKCDNKHELMKQQALSFTFLSQKLLFKGETNNFQSFRKSDNE